MKLIIFWELSQNFVWYIGLRDFDFSNGELCVWYFGIFMNPRLFMKLKFIENIEEMRNSHSVLSKLLYFMD